MFLTCCRYTENTITGAIIGIQISPLFMARFFHKGKYQTYFFTVRLRNLPTQYGLPHLSEVNLVSVFTAFSEV